MDLALLLARLLLVGVFATAGVAKLVDLDGSRRAMRGFGLPDPLASRAGTLLPAVELIIAVALVPTATAAWGALAALLLLVVFLAGIGANLALGRHPQCHCFGQLHSEPVGWPILVRNGVLTAFAAFVVLAGWGDPGPSVVGWMDETPTVAGVALAVAAIAIGILALEGWALIQIVRQNGRLLMRLDAVETALANAGMAAAPVADEAGLPIGSPAPEFALPGLDGRTKTLLGLRDAGKPVLLVFSDAGCGPCTALLPELNRWHTEHGDRLTLAILGAGSEEDNRAKAGEHGLDDVMLLQSSPELAEAYRAYGTPAAVIVQPDGTVGSAVALGGDAIRALVTSVARSAGPGIGAAAPSLTLPDLDGRPVGIADTAGRPKLLLFWSPGCGFCSAMLDDLKAWEASRPAGAPDLLVVSSGDIASNRAMGLSAPIVLDQTFDAGQAFGAGGTPSAILIDAEGRIASTCAVGASAVLALARGNASTFGPGRLGG